MRFPRHPLAKLILAAALVPVVPFANAAPDPAAQPATTAPAYFFPHLTDPRLPYAFRITDKLLAGAQPEGDEGFAALRDLGIKTIISVDGAAPDVETAKKFGLRYVHLPIEYSGVTPAQGRAIAKAIAELPGPIYLHCHHGKHRSAAAAAVGCVFNGTLPPERAESVLQTLGTGANYKGLWQAARDARPLDPATFSAIHVTYVPVAKIPDLADAMVKVDQRTDLLKLVQKAGWKTPADHPDLDPAHEGLQLQELLHEIGRTHDATSKPEDFRRHLTAADEAADALRATLSATPIDTAAADAAMKRVTTSCLDCHKVYRD